MGWLSFKEDGENTTQNAQDNKPLQIQQPLSESGSSSSSSGSDGSEDVNIDDELGSIGGTSAHE
jgi:hypothetical protein